MDHLVTKNNKFKEAIGNLLGKIGDKNKEIKDKNREIAELKHVMADLNSRIINKDKEISLLGATLETKDA